MHDKSLIYQHSDKWYGYSKFNQSRNAEFSASRANMVLCSIAPPEYLPFNLGANIIDKIVNNNGYYIDRHTYFKEQETLTYHSKRTIKEFDLIGISAYMIFQSIAIPSYLFYNKIQPLARFRSDEDSIILLGGQLFPFINIYSKFIDVACIGEGEEFILKILEIVQRRKEGKINKSEALKEISGIEGAYVPGYNDENTINKTYVRDIHKSLLNNNDLNSKYTRKVIEVARGCKYMCAFCSLSRNMFPFRENEVNEVKLVIDTFPEKSHIYPFAPDESSYSGHNNIRDYSINKGMYYYRYNHRANTVTEETIKQSNLSNRIVFGIDGISQRVIDIVNKNINLEDFKKKAIEVFKAKYTLMKLNYVFNYPFENEEDYKELREFWNYLVAKRYEIQGYEKDSKKTMIQIAPTPFVPEPNTPMYFLKIKPAIDQRFYNIYRDIQHEWFDVKKIPPFLKIQGMQSRDAWFAEVVLIRLGWHAQDFIYYLYKNKYSVAKFNSKFMSHLRAFCQINKIKYYDLLDEIYENQNVYKNINWAGDKFDGQKKNYQLFLKMKEKIA